MNHANQDHQFTYDSSGTQYPLSPIIPSLIQDFNTLGCQEKKEEKSNYTCTWLKKRNKKHVGLKVFHQPINMKNAKRKKEPQIKWLHQPLHNVMHGQQFGILSTL